MMAIHAIEGKPSFYGLYLLIKGKHYVRNQTVIKNIIVFDFDLHYYIKVKLCFSNQTLLIMTEILIRENKMHTNAINKYYSFEKISLMFGCMETLVRLIVLLYDDTEIMFYTFNAGTRVSDQLYWLHLM